MKLKTVLAAFAAMVTMGVNAQSWTAPTPSYSTEWATPTDGQTYYIYNVGAGTFLGGGRSWGTRVVSTIDNIWAEGDAVVSPAENKDYAYPFTLQSNQDGTWYLVHKGTNKANKYMFYQDGNDAYIDNTTSHKNAKWNITSTENGYRLDMPNKSGKYFGVHSTNLVSASLAYTWSDFGDTGADKWIYWQFVPESEVSSIKASAALYFARLALYNELVKAESEGVSTVDASAVYTNTNATSTELNSATTALHQARIDYRSSLASETNPQDLTDLVVVNADFSTKDATGWTRTQTSVGNQQFGTGAMESWNNNNVSVLQTLTNLANGKYRVSCDMISGNAGRTAYVYAKGMTEVNGEHVNAQASAGNYNTMSNEVAGKTVNAYPVIVGDHTMTIGFKDPSGWVVVDNFKVIYYGPDLTAFKEALQAQIDAVPALQGTTTTAAYNAAKNYADGINMDNLTTEEAISTASNELSSLVNAATALQGSYSRYAAIRDAALAISADVVLPDVESATTTAAIDAAIPTLRDNFLAELPNVTVPAAGIDVTAVMVDNASVSQNTNYWTAEGTPNTSYSWAVCNYGECEFYQQNFKFYQALALTPGTWEFGVTGFHRAGNHSTYFYAGEDKILIPGVESSVVNTMAQAQTYFDNGNGKVALKFLIETAGDVEIGIDNQDTQTDKWTIFRDFTLKYFGAPDYSIYEQEWNNAVAAAEAAKSASANANVTGDELTAVNDAIADSPAGSDNKATYVAKINALNDATQAFNAAAPSYDAYVAYKNETIALWGSDFNVAAPTTAAGAADAVHALNIAQYNKVANDYPFSATGLIGDFGSWTGTATVAGQPGDPNYLDWEHWSGQTHAYYEQDADGWSNANGWTIKYEKTCTLPAGDYVIKVAARSSVGTTSSISCTATGVTISLPNVGGAPNRGINTSGEASWSDEDEFANGDIRQAANAPTVGGKGTGWQWRFLPFTLTEQSEVTMTFYAEASTLNQWMSIADGELLSTTKLAEDVAYDENSDNTIENKIIADVTMSRTIKEGYNTVVLPFTLTANQVAAAFGTGTEVYAFSENSTDANDVTINFNKGDGSITANVPVLVKATAASSAQTFNGVQVVAPTEGAIVMGTNTKFIGVFGPLEAIPAGDYFIGNGALYKSAGSTSIKAFRAYINAQDAIAPVKMFIGGIATGINEINGAIATEDNAPVFNLAGQRVNKAQKGIYIQNGKKVLVK